MFPFMRAACGRQRSDDRRTGARTSTAAPGDAADRNAAQGLAKLIFDLGDLLERHIRKEERELFPLFEAHVDAAQAELIGAKLKELRKCLKASDKLGL